MKENNSAIPRSAKKLPSKTFCCLESENEMGFLGCFCFFVLVVFFKAMKCEVSQTKIQIVMSSIVFLFLNNNIQLLRIKYKLKYLFLKRAKTLIFFNFRFALKFWDINKTPYHNSSYCCKKYRSCCDVFYNANFWVLRRMNKICHFFYGGI